MNADKDKDVTFWYLFSNLKIINVVLTHFLVFLFSRFSGTFYVLAAFSYLPERISVLQWKVDYKKLIWLVKTLSYHSVKQGDINMLNCKQPNTEKNNKTNKQHSKKKEIKHWKRPTKEQGRYLHQFSFLFLGYLPILDQAF